MDAFNTKLFGGKVYTRRCVLFGTPYRRKGCLILGMWSIFFWIPYRPHSRDGSRVNSLRCRHQGQFVVDQCIRDSHVQFRVEYHHQIYVIKEGYQYLQEYCHHQDYVE